MQFHLNGFRSGDPHVLDVAEETRRPVDFVDVLIVGCGPAGLTLAAQLSAFADLNVRIIEQKPGPLDMGQADGVACRSMEMFEAFGFSERVLKEAYWVNETSFWRPGEADRSAIVRGGRIPDTEDGLSEFPHVILNQARIHDFLLDVMRSAPTRMEPAYDRRLVGLTVDWSDIDYPVTARVERPGGKDVETVRAKFLVGCDGARSAVRTLIGETLRGDSANQAWGVMDVLAVTDFPDIRLKATIHSANEGNVLIIPREGGYLVRFYVELDKLRPGERVAGRDVTIETLIAAAQRALSPYVLAVKEVAWWSVYEIGQRLCDRFDDGAARDPAVFLAGDACHTHSPKAGQGMNVSIADAFNLGWKLAAVLRGQASPDLLRTYSAERHTVAQELIDFDRTLAQMFSARPKDPSDPTAEGVDPAEFQDYFVRQGRFTAGTATHYDPSLVIGDGAHQHLAEGFLVGKRFHSAPVIRLADARPMQLGHVLKADGRWRLVAFAPAEDPAAPTSQINALCAFLAESPFSPIRRYTPRGADVDAVIDVRVIFQQGHRTLAVDAMPTLLSPAKGRYGLRDHEKLFCADLRGGADIFDLRRVDRAEGCVVIVRPDQFVAAVLPIEAHGEIAVFFDGFMIAAPDRPALGDGARSDRRAHVERV